MVAAGTEIEISPYGFPINVSNEGLSFRSIPAEDYVNDFGNISPEGIPIDQVYYSSSALAEQRYGSKPISEISSD
ncbi:MAG: hypothetical protein HOE90_20870 [Bacteriovoracaceae bacterium]|jgi:hypothetical protein|nr:hypothetical protein [Bacteriovoracaceae bacterium]